MEEKNSQKSWDLVIIVIVVIAVIIAFILSLGSIKITDKKEPDPYDGIDFGKIPEDINQAIKEIEEKLREITSRKEKVMKRINMTLVFIKILFLCAWVGTNILIAKYGSSDFGVNEFVVWNQAIIIGLLFFLFVLSEKFSSVYTAFSALKLLIVKRVTIKLHINGETEKILNGKLYLLEAIRDCHPGILHRKNTQNG